MTEPNTVSSFYMMDDNELYCFFSDFYKTVLGFRPRGDFWTRERVVEWCERETSPEAMERHQAEWAAEAEMNDRLEAEWKDLETEWKADATSKETVKESMFDSKYEEMAWAAGYC